MNDLQQASEALADFCILENLPDAAEVCARAAGLLAERTRGDIGNQEYAQHVQHLAASLARNSGVLDYRANSQH